MRCRAWRLCPAAWSEGRPGGLASGTSRVSERRGPRGGGDAAVRGATSGMMMQASEGRLYLPPWRGGAAWPAWRRRGAGRAWLPPTTSASSARSVSQSDARQQGRGGVVVGWSALRAAQRSASVPHPLRTSWHPKHAPGAGQRRAGPPPRPGHATRAPLAGPGPGTAPSWRSS
eukprot:scaffold1275_cov401-Prasinococcus_capsulatus_cf.AAC.10